MHESQICPFCHHSNGARARFCGFCGQAIRPEALPGPRSPGRRELVLILTGLGLALVLCFGGFSVFAWLGKDQTVVLVGSILKPAETSTKILAPPSVSTRTVSVSSPYPNITFSPSYPPARTTTPSLIRPSETTATATQISISALRPTGRIAFALNDSNIRQSLNVVNADGSGAKKLLDGRIYLNGPCWSPDGQKIAFSSNRDSPMPESSVWANDLFDIYVISADGTGLRRLTTDTDLNNCRGWSPDGSSILVEAGRARSSRRVYVLNIATGAKRKISPGEENSGGARFSPDGKRIAFGGNQALYIVNADGTGLKELFNPLYSHDSPRSVEWSPDGTIIAFESNGRAHTIRPDGSGHKDWERGSGPIWRPGGIQLGVYDNGFKSYSLDGRLIFQNDLDRQGWVVLTWSPDGNFLIAKNGYDEFEIVTAYLTSPQPIIQMKGRDPVWFAPPSRPTSNPTTPPSTVIPTSKPSSYSSAADFARLANSIGSRYGLTVVDAGIYNTVAQVTFTRETNRSDGLSIIQSMTQVFRELAPGVFDNMPSVMGMNLQAIGDFRDPNGKMVSMNGMMILAITRRTAGSLDWKTYRSQDLDKILFAGEDPLRQGNVFHIDPAWQSAWIMFQHQ